MKIPTKYSDLSPKQRGVLGYILTFCGFASLGVINQFVFTFFVVLTYLIAFGMIIRHVNSPYYLTWSLGSSMMPAIPLGLTLNLSTKHLDNVEIGDVISYKPDNDRYNGATVHHRIIDQTETAFIVKGDGNEYADPDFVHKDQIKHRSVQYGNQPIYIPFSPLAIVTTLIKFYKKVQGKHGKLLDSYIDTPD